MDSVPSLNLKKLFRLVVPARRTYPLPLRAIWSIPLILYGPNFVVIRLE
jgi:hypothetical protein